jgi:alkaline phosphatase
MKAKIWPWAWVLGVIISSPVHAQKQYEETSASVVHVYKSEKTYAVKSIEPTTGKKVDNVILMIADGMGISHFTSAWIANRGRMNMDNCMHTGLVRTYAANELITDSGAAGSAMATGKKGNYHSISVNTENDEPLASLTDLANAKGLSTGIVVTCGLTDATPATFCANNVDRNNEEELAVDFTTCNVNFLFGGGRSKFHNRASDDRDILSEMKELGYTVCETIDETLAAKNDKVLAIIEEGQLPLADERGDLFQKATGKALSMLDQNKKGFFVMIEGSRIDDCGHWNDLPKLVEEIGDFDITVGQVLEWAQKDGKTLVVILSDHETGGLSITGGSIEYGEMQGLFANKSHSGILVPVYAYGPQSEQFTGFMENTDVFEKIKSLLKL